MTAAWTEERPRNQLAVPAPTPMHSARSKGKEDTIKALREKLSEYQAENNLLGTLVKELKAERDGLQKRLASTAKQHTDAASRAATAVQQVDAAGRDQKRLAAEVERLSSVVHSHSVRLQKAKALQQELEDVALDLRAELDEARAKQEAAEQAAAAAAQRATAAEAKLEAAGMGPMPKMGPTAEQLVINSTQRIRELTEELATLRTEGQQKLADAQQQLQHTEQQWQQQLDAAKAEAREAQQQLERRLQQQAWELQQQSARAQESEQQCRGLQQQVLSLQQTQREAQLSSEACTELERSRQALSRSNQALQQQVAQLQQQLADRESAQAASESEQQQLLAAVQREKQDLSANVAAVRQAETSHRLSTAEASSKIERLRSELLRCVGELQSQLAASTAAGQQHQQAQQQLRALEATAAAARAEAAEARQQLVELASVTMAELREQVAGQTVAITGLPDDMGRTLPGAVTSYIKVLENTVADCEKRSKLLLVDALTAQQYEREARQALAAAREAQAAAERALQQQTQRLMAAERMRLSDLKEQQSLEKRLALAQQECANLRDALLSRGSNSTNWQQQMGLVPAGPPQQPMAASGAWSPTAVGPAGFAAACAAVGNGSVSNCPGEWALQAPHSSAQVGAAILASASPGKVGSPGAGRLAGVAAGGWSTFAADAAAAAAAAVVGETLQASPSKRQQPGQAVPYQPFQQPQQAQQQLWQVPAADAGHTGADVAAHSSATISRYQAKLAQLRAMKEQLLRKTYGDSPNNVTLSNPHVDTGPAPQQQQQLQQPLQQQQQQQQEPALAIPPAPAGRWGPQHNHLHQSEQEDWLIGAGSAGGGVTVSAHTSMDPSNTCSGGGISSYGTGAVQSSSGGGASHLSEWSLSGKLAGTAGCGDQSAGGVKEHFMNTSSSSIDKKPAGISQAAGVEKPSSSTSSTSTATAMRLPGNSQSAGGLERQSMCLSSSSIAKKLAGDAQLSKLGESIQKLRSAAAAGAHGCQAVASRASTETQQHKQQKLQQQQQDRAGAASRGQGLVRSAGDKGQRDTAGLGLNGRVVAAVPACDVGKTPTAQGSRRVSREASRQSSFTATAGHTASTRGQLYPVSTSGPVVANATTTVGAGNAPAGGVGMGSASHGLSSRSNLQRWAQPQQREQQRQQQVLSRQHSNIACGNRRVTGGSSGRSSLV